MLALLNACQYVTLVECAKHCLFHEKQHSGSAAKMLRSTNLALIPCVKHAQQAVMKVPMRRC